MHVADRPGPVLLDGCCDPLGKSDRPLRLAGAAWMALGVAGLALG